MMDLKALPFPFPTCFQSQLFRYEGRPNILPLSVARSCPGPTYLTRWKMRRSKVLRWVRESWSMTEYTPRTASFLSWRPVKKAPEFRGGFYFFLLFKTTPS